MKGTEDPWILPSTAAFLDELEAAALDGIVCVNVDITMPIGFAEALASRARSGVWRVERLLPLAGGQPAAVIAEPFGVAPTLDALLSETLAEHLGIIDLSKVAPTDIEAWTLFSERFSEKRQLQPGGLALVLIGPIAPSSKIGTCRHLSWSQRLRRVDVTIWTDLHAPLDQQEPLSSLAAALGVELCGWRLDLAAAIARASRSDLLDPLGWLARRDEQAMSGEFLFGGRPMLCPLQLLAEGGQEELRRRIWRAQLGSIFPWIEELRQKVVKQHRKRLSVDSHLFALGLRDVEEIEFGSIAWQLERSRALPRDEMEFIRGLADIRNALAHRTPAPVPELERVLGNVRLTSRHRQ